MRVYLQTEKRVNQALTLFEKKTIKLDIAIGLAVRISGFHQQDTGSTPGNMKSIKKNLN